MTDFQLQRKNMVESQVRPSDITDRRITRAMLELPREAFAGDAGREIAYMDRDLPVEPGSAGMPARALLAPRVLAHLVQLLEIEQGDRVLEIGAATGYGAAVISRLAKSVVALERDEALAARAVTALSALSIDNVAVVSGHHAAGWPAEAPYAAILLSGAVPEVPAVLLDQLQEGGRLAAVVHSGGVGHLMQWRRLAGGFASRRVAEAGGARLPGFEKAPSFAF